MQTKMVARVCRKVYLFGVCGQKKSADEAAPYLCDYRSIFVIVTCE